MTTEADLVGATKSGTDAGPLTGIRVLSLENFLAGNHETWLLGMLGADIIKVERPIVGDAMRDIGPFLKGPKGSRSAGELRVMPNKRSIAIDMSLPEGRNLFFSLVSSVDVVYSNQKPSSLATMGINFETLKARNPKIVYSTLSGFGHDDVIPSGPFGNWPAYDVIAQGLAGLQFRAEGVGGRPAYNGLPIGDEVTSLISIIGILSALHRRDTTGTAQRVDVAMHDAMVFVNELAIGNLSLLGTIAGRGRSQTSAPYGAFKCLDGWVNIGVGVDDMWRRFCDAIGRKELANDAKYRSSADRVVRQDELNDLVLGWTGSRTVQEIIDILLSFGVVCAPVYDLPQVLESEQVTARHMLVEVDDPIVGKQRVVGNPLKFGGVDDCHMSPPPLRGEHTAEILDECLGLDAVDIKALVDVGAIELSK
jgi:CoA:oxalate CoA-transferase